MAGRFARDPTLHRLSGGAERLSLWLAQPWLPLGLGSALIGPQAPSESSGDFSRRFCQFGDRRLECSRVLMVDGGGDRGKRGPYCLPRVAFRLFAGLARGQEGIELRAPHAHAACAYSDGGKPAGVDPLSGLPGYPDQDRGGRCWVGHRCGWSSHNPGAFMKGRACPRLLDLDLGGAQSGAREACAGGQRGVGWAVVRGRVRAPRLCAACS